MAGNGRKFIPLGRGARPRVKEAKPLSLTVHLSLF